MAEKAKHIKKDGTVCTVSAKAAARIPKYERRFRCVGKDSLGNERNSIVSLVKSERNGKEVLYFRGHDHIKGCSNLCCNPEVKAYIESIDEFSFDDFFRHLADDRKDPVNPGHNDGEEDTPFDVDVDEEDVFVRTDLQYRAPRSVKALYEVLSSLPLDFIVDGKKVADILVTEKTHECEYTNLEGYKVLTVQRCNPPKGLEKSASQIVVRICGVRDTFLVLNIPEKKLRQKVWNLIYPKKISNTDSSEKEARRTSRLLPKILVAGRVSRLQENIYACDVLDGRMVAKLK